MQDFIANLPKVELHLHIEGTLEPELMFTLAQRNNITLPYANPDQLRQAYEFTQLQDFLDIYYQGAGVLIEEQDFYDLTWAYLLRCQADKVIHTEIFFDPQTHTDRGIDFATVINGIHRALEDGQTQLGITSKLIMCFLRHLSEEAAFATLEQAKPHLDKLVAVGLDSTEIGHPPAKHQRVLAAARELGLLTVSHAGEEGPAANITDSLDLLKVSRIDHGVACDQDPVLLQRLIDERIPLTVCPLSNTKLQVYERMEDHNIVILLRQGVCVTINSDDPAYFGGYMNDNFMAVANAHDLSKEELAQFSLNAIEASFIDEQYKQELRAKVGEYLIAS